MDYCLFTLDQASTLHIEENKFTSINSNTSFLKINEADIAIMKNNKFIFN